MRALKKLAARIPTQIPYTKDEFEQWVQSIFEIHGLEDKPSSRLAIAQRLMHLGPTESHKSKNYFAKIIQRSLANEAAYETIQALKQQEDDYIESKAAKPAQAIETQSDHQQALENEELGHPV